MPATRDRRTRVPRSPWPISCVALRSTFRSRQIGKAHSRNRAVATIRLRSSQALHASSLSAGLSPGWRTCSHCAGSPGRGRGRCRCLREDHAQAGELVPLLVAQPDLFLGQQVDVGAIQRRDLRVEDARPVRRRDGIQFLVQGMQFAAHRAQGDALDLRPEEIVQAPVHHEVRHEEADDGDDEYAEDEFDHGGRMRAWRWRSGAIVLPGALGFRLALCRICE